MTITLKQVCTKLRFRSIPLLLGIYERERNESRPIIIDFFIPITPMKSTFYDVHVNHCQFILKSLPYFKTNNKKLQFSHLFQRKWAYLPKHNRTLFLHHGQQHQAFIYVLYFLNKQLFNDVYHIEQLNPQTKISIH